jgi:hypothetical protein
MNLKNILNIFQKENKDYYYPKKEKSFDLYRDKDYIMMFLKDMH